MNFVVLLFAALISLQVHAGCEDMVPFGKPVVTVTEQVTYLCRRMYVLEHSPTRHTAYWSAEILKGEEQGLDGDRKNYFRSDPNLPRHESADTSDYLHTKYDMGHLAPVGDMYADPIAMRESFYLSNMIPQVPGNNRNGWRMLEDFVRELSQVRGELFVITGPVYKGQYTTIGKTKVAVPTHIYKIIYDPKSSALMSFLVPNVPFTRMEIPNYISSLKEIEEVTQVKFFPNLTGIIIESTQVWTARTN